MIGADATFPVRRIGRPGAKEGPSVSLVESLLDAITRLDGDALVMHAGEKPYVVTAGESPFAFRGPLNWGQVELSTRT
jgi:hypothetical protein